MLAVSILDHLVNLIEELHDQHIEFKVLTGQGGRIDTVPPAPKMGSADVALLSAAGSDAAFHTADSSRVALFALGIR